METAVIRLHTYEPCILTTEEFEALDKEVTARAIVDDRSIGDRILHRLLVEHMPRYFEAKRLNAARTETPRHG